ncbi:hypothetical protein T492DRAFT_979940 [Pavlovales sp. CCMP2436]|nr:hypothetical protein T492DRAFT_979940 [Pavlovales sp. CCMP2436]
MAPKVTEKPVGPKYGEMVKEGILAMKDRGGSSLPAIKKWLSEKYPAATNASALKSALQHGVKSSVLVKVKASYKVHPDHKKGSKSAAPKKKAAEEAPKAKKTAVKKTAKKATTAKKTAKPAAKKSAAKPKAAAKPKKAIAKNAKASPKKK